MDRDQAAALLDRLADRHGLQLALSVGSMKRQAGKCFPDRNEIRLSRHLLADHPERVEPVLRHEIGHALAHSRHGSDIRPHGREWHDAMADLGVDEPKRTHELVLVEPDYLLTCENDSCDAEIRRYRKSKVVEEPEKYRCGECGARLRRDC
ncbi:MAG: SprT-like domain-containing protein [Candidatus Nanohaloarchaea archaeon]|nr:SprT-like domain-containing protein [Candidatus Nanohaloarchaea archaeon]